MHRMGEKEKKECEWDGLSGEQESGETVSENQGVRGEGKREKEREREGM